MFCCSLTTLFQFLTTSLLFFSFHIYPNPAPSPAQFYFPVVTEKGRRSCLLMAPGACGSRLANQCESTSGTSLGQTIYQRTLSLLSDPHPFLSGSQAGRHPLGGSARSHIGETFPKAFPVLLASRQPVTFLPSCVFHKHTRGPKGTRGQRYPFVDMLDWGWGAAGLVQVATLMRSTMSVQPVVII